MFLLVTKAEELINIAKLSLLNIVYILYSIINIVAYINKLIKPESLRE